MHSDWIRPIPIHDPLAPEVTAVDLDRMPADVAWAGVSPDEQARAQRFRHPRDQIRYCAAHAALRTLVAQRLGRPPLALRFHTNAHGKPALSEEPVPLHFNLSHSQGTALIALSAHHEVGIDLEVQPIRSDAVDALAPTVASPTERTLLAALDAHAVGTAFLGMWTGKEAVLKALGLGLSADPCQVHIGVATPRRRAVSVDALPHLGATRPRPLVNLWALPMDAGTVAHVAARSCGPQALH